MTPRALPSFTVAGLLAALALPVAAFAQTTISAGSGNYNANAAGSYILNAGDTRSVASGGTEVISIGGATGPFTLTVNGTVSQNGSGRGIRTSNNNVVFNFSVGATGQILAKGDDAIQARNGTFNLTNSGTIYSGPNLAVTPGTALASGQALDLVSAVGGTIINQAGGLIRADGHDAVRLGNNMSFTNHGTVISKGVVNDSPANNVFNLPPLNTSTAETYSANEGVSFENGSNSSLTNYGLISGSRHGVETDVSATNITITNQAGGQMIGRNGSGVGSDATSASVTNITVNNTGLIRGDYAGVGNVIDRTGSPSPTHDGDGDGVDIDGAATINNYAGGQIIGNGAGGFDSGGRANTSDGISIGGGIINNAGLIQGAGVGIVVNNDTNASRSGVAATTITNSAGGMIEGLNGYAIRLENKLGDARDNDTLVNAGTIIGGGSIPNPAGTVLRQNGVADANSTGTLDGVIYTGSGAARFVRGDGSAVQMGEGDDVLGNSGTITGLTGRAINLEGGNDKMTVSGGAINGAINGGAGTDTLLFDLGSPAQHFVQNGAITNFEQIDIASGRVQMAGALDLGNAANLLRVHPNGILDVAAGSLSVDRGSVLMEGALRFVLESGDDYGRLFFAASNAGGLTLANTSVLELELGYTPLMGQQFTLVEFLGSGSFVSGIFAGLAEGADFFSSGYRFQISYQGNDGNDIVVTRAVPDAGATVGLLAAALGLMACWRRRLQG